MGFGVHPRERQVAVPFAFSLPCCALCCDCASSNASTRQILVVGGGQVNAALQTMCASRTFGLRGGSERGRYYPASARQVAVATRDWARRRFGISVERLFGTGLHCYAPSTDETPGAVVQGARPPPPAVLAGWLRCNQGVRAAYSQARPTGNGGAP